VPAKSNSRIREEYPENSGRFSYATRLKYGIIDRREDSPQTQSDTKIRALLHLAASEHVEPAENKQVSQWLPKVSLAFGFFAEGGVESGPFFDQQAVPFSFVNIS
jgi:hypothetical protein